jgi:hypothetical protein
MKKTLAVLAIAGLVLIVIAVSVFAYAEVEGCVVDGATGQPWTHGGTVTSEQNGQPGPETTLDGNGCFSMSIGFDRTEIVIVVDPDPGPDGDPSPIDPYCTVPADPGGQGTYTCSDMATDTGPNAVTWTVVSANTSAGFPLEAAAFGFLALILAGGGIALWRQQRLTS